MRATAVIGLLLVISLVSVSSYLRLQHSGLGCTPWPECYGNIGWHDEESDIEDAYERLVAEARDPTSWARPLHRLIASALGLLVLGFVGYSLIRGRQRVLSIALLALTVFLAGIGIYSEGLHSPAIVIGNLSGGFAMLGIFAWLVFDPDERDAKPIDNRPFKGIVTIALLVLCVQILLGGLTSANFAATACSTLPHCNGQWIPGSELWTAFDLSRSIQVNDYGVVVGGAERAAIHLLHRIVSVMTVMAILAASVQAIRADRRLLPTGTLICVFVIAEMTLGIAAVQTGMPIAVAVSHNWIAGLLLLGLIKLRIESVG